MCKEGYRWQVMGLLLDKIVVRFHHKLEQEGEAKCLSLCSSGGSVTTGTVLATLTRDVQAKLTSNSHLMGDDPRPLSAFHAFLQPAEPSAALT